MITLRLVRANTSSLQACCPAMLALVLKLRQAVKPPRIDGNNPPARRSGRERLAVTMLKKHTSFSVQQQLGVDGPNLFQLEELEVLPSKATFHDAEERLPRCAYKFRAPRTAGADQLEPLQLGDAVQDLAVHFERKSERPQDSSLLRSLHRARRVPGCFPRRVQWKAKPPRQELGQTAVAAPQPSLSKGNASP